MFDSMTPGHMQGPVHVAAVAHVAREAKWSLDAERSYLVPCLFWITGGQGRIAIEGQMRGFTAHNAIFLPANTAHAIEIAPSTQGMAVFFNAPGGLACPECVLHLRMHGLGRQADLTRMVDDIAREAASGASDSETVLFHQSALLIHLLRRNAPHTLPLEPGAATEVQEPENRLTAERAGRS